jgi:hypothetical protein
MTIRAQSADGVIHEFPDGTNPAVVDRAMHAYAVSKAPKAKSAGGYLASEVGGAVSGAFDQLKTDAKGVWDGAGKPLPANPFSLAAQKQRAGDLARTGRMVLDVGNLALSPVAGLTHAVAVNPLTKAINASPVPVYTDPGVLGLLRGERPQRLEGDARRTQIEHDVNRAVSAVGPGKVGPRPIPVKTAPVNPFAEKVAAFDTAGVRPSLAAMSEGAARVAKGVAENPIAGVRARGALRGSIEDTSNAAGRVASRFGSPMDSRGAAGEAVQRGVEDFNKRFSARSSAMYDPIFSKIDTAERAAVAGMPNTPVVKPTETVAALRQMTSRVNSPALSEMITDKRLPDIMAAIEGDPNSIRFNDLRQLRTWVRNAQRDPELRKGIDQASLGRLEGALTHDIYANAESLGGPKTARQLKQADSFYRMGSQRIDGALQKFVGGRSPVTGEGAYDLVLRAAGDKGGADTARLSALRKSLQPHEWNDVAATVVNRLGKPLPGQGEDTFSISRFVTGFDGLSPQGKDLLFGKGALRGELENLSRVARMQKNVERAANHSNTMAGGQAVATAVGLVNPLTAAPTAKLLGGMAITGEMMTNPLAVRWLARLSQAKAAGGAALRTQVRALGSAANDNAALIPLAEQARLLLSQPQAAAAPLAAQDKRQQK